MKTIQKMIDGMKHSPIKMPKDKKQFLNSTHELSISQGNASKKNFREFSQSVVSN
jgi:hypothetical protein